MASVERLRTAGARPFPGRRLAIRLALAIILLVVLIYAAVSLGMAYQLTLGNHKPLGADGSIVETPFENVSFPSRVDAITLRGWLFRAPSLTGRSAVIVHGFRQNRVNADLDAVDLSKSLLAHGYDVLLFDLRSCGTSSGDRFTLGTLEPRDLLGAYDFLLRRHYSPGKMAIIGDSEGAATVIGAAKDLGAVGALVADSSFAELKPIIDMHLPQNTSLPPIFFPGGEIASELFGLDPFLRPVDEIRALPSRAFLFFHGSADGYVPLSHARELKDASANPESELVIVTGADHVKSYRTNPTLYLARLYQFLDQQIAERGG